jgi:Tfp pilus assembly protein PilO
MTMGHSSYTKRQLLGLHAGGVTVVCAVLWCFYVMLLCPMNEQRQALVAEQERLEMMLESHPKVVSNYQRFEEQISVDASRLQRLLGRIGDRSQADRVIQALNECGDEASVTIVSMQPMSARQGQLAMLQTVRLSLRCDYVTLCRFLSLVYQRDELMWVAEVDVKCEVSGGNREGYGVRRADLMIQIPHSIHDGLLPESRPLTAMSGGSAPLNLDSFDISDNVVSY